ncbi:MAG: hypothetical protein KC708_04675 [Anaerolineae bacterium]|nr:hypothetical protein [Anaerolineae bacterium]
MSTPVSGESIRCYAVMHAPVGNAPTLNEWRQLLNGLDLVLDLGVNQVAKQARHHVSFGKISQGAGRLGASTLISFELSPADAESLLVGPNSHMRQRARAVGLDDAVDDRRLVEQLLRRLPGEALTNIPDLRTDLGWTRAKATAISNGIQVEVITLGESQLAQAQMQRYLRDHASDWYL